jgi:hypothetical protein
MFTKIRCHRQQAEDAWSLTAPTGVCYSVDPRERALQR